MTQPQSVTSISLSLTMSREAECKKCSVTFAGLRLEHEVTSACSKETLWLEYQSMQTRFENATRHWTSLTNTHLKLRKKYGKLKEKLKQQTPQ